MFHKTCLRNHFISILVITASFIANSHGNNVNGIAPPINERNNFTNLSNSQKHQELNIDYASGSIPADDRPAIPETCLSSAESNGMRNHSSGDEPHRNRDQESNDSNRPRPQPQPQQPQQQPESVVIKLDEIRDLILAFFGDESSGDESESGRSAERGFTDRFKRFADRYFSSKSFDQALASTGRVFFLKGNRLENAIPRNKLIPPLEHFRHQKNDVAGLHWDASGQNGSPGDVLAEHNWLLGQNSGQR